MPFTGAGTNIANADDVFFTTYAQDQVLRLNLTTHKWNNVALSVGSAELANDSVTEPKLAISNSPSSNQLLRWNGTALEWATLSYEAAIAAGTTAQYYRGDKTWQTLDKTAVGLANVDNTSDANKPVSTATATALSGKVDKSTATTKGDLFQAHNTPAVRPWDAWPSRRSRANRQLEGLKQIIPRPSGRGKFIRSNRRINRDATCRGYGRSCVDG